MHENAPGDPPESEPDPNGPGDAGAIILPCPHCQGAVQATPTDRPQVLDCPHCGQPFVLPAAGQQLAVASLRPSDEFVTDDTEEPLDRDDLDGLRIRKISQMKRAANRTRSWWLIAAIGALAGAGQCLWNTVTAIRHPPGGAAVAYGVIALWMLATAMCIYLAVRFFHRAEQCRRAAAITTLKPPDHPPDFTGLSDGSQRWKNLQDLSDDDDKRH